MSTIKSKAIDSEVVSLARESAAHLGAFLANLTDEDQRAHVKIGDEDLILPRSAVHLLREILSAMASGKSVSVMPTGKTVTTQQAADILNVSRPYLIGLLEDNAIPFVLVGTHRRIKFQDVLEYKDKLISNSSKAMDDFSNLTNDMGV